MTRFLSLLLLVLCTAAGAAADNAPARKMLQDAVEPQVNYGKTNNDIFLGKEDPDLCDIGPTYWCQSEKTRNLCMVNNKTVGVCGYSSAYNGCPRTSIADFCASNPSAQQFNGGLAGSPAGYFGYFALAMYWAPSSCNSTTASGGFCSPFTTATSYSASHLVLHGLWPDYGSLYTAPFPKKPTYSGSYQGWPQWCDGDGIKTSQCTVGPDQDKLCTQPNSTYFSQSALESCFCAQNVKECLVPDEVLTALGNQFKDIAPGYLAGTPSNPTLAPFCDHEYFKHGSCIGGYLSHNITAYYDTAVQLAYKITGAGTAADKLIHGNKGGRVDAKKLERSLKGQAVPTCKRGSCTLEEIWYCLDRTAAGFPTDLIVCPIGTLASNSCASNNCRWIDIPAWK